MKQRRRLRVSSKFLSLGAFDIAVESEAARVGALTEDHPDVGQSLLVDRCECHRLGIIDFRRRRFLEPQPEKRNRILGFGEVG